MTGRILRLQRDHGVGALCGEDGKTYSFRRNDVRGGWFHDLSEGATVSFEAAQAPKHLEATLVRSAVAVPGAVQAHVIGARASRMPIQVAGYRK
jgi:cold shock CspA family protein